MRWKKMLGTLDSVIDRSSSVVWIRNVQWALARDDYREYREYLQRPQQEQESAQENFQICYLFTGG